MAKSDIEVKVKNEYIQRLEGETDSLFVIKLAQPISTTTYDKLCESAGAALNKVYPGSTLLILPDYIDTIRHISEQDLNDLGWFKKLVD